MAKALDALFSKEIIFLHFKEAFFLLDMEKWDMTQIDTKLSINEWTLIVFGSSSHPPYKTHSVKIDAST